MIDDPQLSFDAALEPARNEETHRTAIGVDVSSLGPVVSIICTDSEATFRFERGTLTTSPEQFFHISRTLSRKADL